MFYTIFFIIPSVFLMLAISMPIALEHNTPKWLNVNLGKLNSEDLRKLHENQLKYLRKAAFINLLLAAILTALVGVIFILLGSADNAIAALICIAIQFTSGWISAYPLIKKTNLIKSEIKDLEKDFS